MNLSADFLAILLYLRCTIVFNSLPRHACHTNATNIDILSSPQLEALAMQQKIIVPEAIFWKPSVGMHFFNYKAA